MTRVSITRKINVRDPSALPLWLQTADGGSLPPLWKWVDVPASNLSSCPPTWAGPGTVPPGIYGPRSKIDAWCGATLKRSGSVYLLGAAGGHGDYAGNEVNAIALSDDAPSWVELRPSSVYADMLTDAVAYLDYRRAATHTYCSTQFDQVNNRMLIVCDGGMDTGLLPAPDPGWPWQRSINRPLMAFDLGTKDWLAPGTLAAIPANVGGTDGMCCAKPDGTEIYAAGLGWTTIQRYTVATNTWDAIGPSGYIVGHGSAMDPDRNQILIVGLDVGSSTPRLFDITAGANLSVSWGGLGPTPIQAKYAGAVYDEENGNYLVATNSGSVIELYRVNPDTYVIDAPTVAGTKPAARLWNMHNAMQYVPELRGIVLANSYTGNLKFMRTA